MKSFPTIKRTELERVFDRILALYNADAIKIFDAAEIGLANIQNPFNRNTGHIDPQIADIKHKIRQTGDNRGREALILLVESLFLNLNTSGANGVNTQNFCDCIRIECKDGAVIKYSMDGYWYLEWKVSTNQGEENISVPLRKVGISQDDIIPHYIVQYINQSIEAYKKENYLTSLSLISIALEGTLRDALEVKGYTYTHGMPSVDSFEIKNVNITNNQNGYSLEFVDHMPRHHNDFLNEQNMNPPHTVRIKRVQKRNNWYLELRDVDYLKDFWSSDVVSHVGHVNISGLGTALSVARDVTKANILDATILPTDVDDLITQVRNNLIHLSGVAMTTQITAVGMSLEAYSSDRNRVFDTILSICETIDKLYSKIADGTL